MKQKSLLKTEKPHEDLDQRINAFYIQNEEEREKAFLDLITEIIVQTTLKEYYEATGSAEKK